ncbi:aspartate/glutamate racemase family protein [Lysinibacillus sp. FSL H8-0500]|uniref:aspartate/glutamate racemase family protein n=1 Tax=Lysinibacillus sp. FSL H8-0500 TaxID=2921393 RepID=UPI003100CDF4
MIESGQHRIDLTAGYFDPSKQTEINMPKGKYVSGYAVGILFLDECWYPILPGNVANLTTYNFPVVLKVVDNCTQERIHRGDPTLEQDIIRAAQELERYGAKAICAACGFFGNYQKAVAEAVNIPVFLSSVIQLPWISSGLKSSQKILMLTADANGITDHVLDNCQALALKDRIVIKDLYHLPEFSAIVQSRGYFDNEQVKVEVLGALAEALEADPAIGAILLECSDLPPYAYAIQQYSQLPVYDFISMINWVHQSQSQKPYVGFI